MWTLKKTEDSEQIQQPIADPRDRLSVNPAPLQP